MKDFEKILLKVINNVFICILLFYIGGLLVIMLVIFWNDIDLNSSFFVKFFILIGVLFVVGVVNFVVLIVVVFVINSGIYLNSCILFGLL